MFTRGEFKGLRLDALTEEIESHAAALRANNMDRAETALLSQATTLDQIFHRLARTAWQNVGNRFEVTERLLRLALKAQSQSRATLETLAFVRNPTAPIFARQANVTTGPQQVNNGVPVARAEQPHVEPSKLLEQTDGEWLDARTTGQTGQGDIQMATVGAIDRTEVLRGQGARGAQRLERRSAGRPTKARQAAE